MIGSSKDPERKGRECREPLPASAGGGGPAAQGGTQDPRGDRGEGALLATHPHSWGDRYKRGERNTETSLESLAAQADRLGARRQQALVGLCHDCLWNLDSSLGATHVSEKRETEQKIS